MDFQFAPAEERLRVEVKAFLGSSLPAVDQRFHPDVPGGDDFEEAKAFNEKLAARGWIAPAWPREYGGLGATIYEQMVFSEEFGYHGAPDNGTRAFGVGMLGPTLIVHGTASQKAEHLPRITTGEAVWCQGYSEPGSGSDLASLQTRAIRDGDDFILNGQKIWTSGGHGANWIFVLARSDPDAPKHKGISFFMVDMKTPGLTVRPLVTMASRHDFNEVFFEDVRVPAANVVGEVNRGWYVGMTLLDFERSGVARTGAQRRTLELFARWLRKAPDVARARARLGLAEMVIQNNVVRALGYRIGDMQTRGQHPSYEASMVKVFQSELSQRIYNFGLNALGLAGQVRAGDGRAPLLGEFAENYMLISPASVYSGSNEVQRNIIASRGLGLPRD
ncbi:acyl-CoA dehydrogenase family protein [Candidatus Amarobacter glycogenicus]|uniref:acyl-CoA dehydrogenase family protein n=1 Tax=Candidatus Amarobacter glycogenicus TaxID=3140699 RepID=UPI002A0B012A|nr:acyl-CoA dehydrogenase family protein [Dehalococcoidia bacterium]